MCKILLLFFCHLRWSSLTKMLVFLPVFFVRIKLVNFENIFLLAMVVRDLKLHDLQIDSHTHVDERM